MRFLLLILTFCGFFALSAQEKANGNTVVLPAGQVHEGDYFVMGDAIEISGTVRGDVYAAGGQVFIDGTVTGDVLAAAGSVQISGHILNNVRIIGGQVNITGKVDHNVTLVVANADLFSTANIGGNLVLISGNGDLGASVGSDATIMSSNVRISGQIKDDVQAYIGSLRLTSNANIGGGLEYSSNDAASIEPGAKIGGEIVHHPSLFHDLFHGSWMRGFLLGSKVAAFLMNFLYTFVIAWILIRLMPKNISAAVHALERKPLKTLGAGLMLLVLLPLASLVLLMTVLGAPFALTLIAINIISFYTAKVYSIMWASNWAFARFGIKPNHLPIFTLGLIGYYVVTSIPFLGIVIAFAALLFGLGAGILAQAHRLKKSHS